MNLAGIWIILVCNRSGGALPLIIFCHNPSQLYLNSGGKFFTQEIITKEEGDKSSVRNVFSCVTQ